MHRKALWMGIGIICVALLLIPFTGSVLADLTTYDFTGITSPSSTHTAEDGEIDETDSNIASGTFGARRGTGISGWSKWGEASTAEYGNLVGSDDNRYRGADPGDGDNAAMIFEFYIAGAPTILRIDVMVELGRDSSTDSGYVYLWNYDTSSYLVGGSNSGEDDAVISFSVTTDPGDYVQDSDGQLTVFVVNQDTSDWIQVDDISVKVKIAPNQAPTADAQSVVTCHETPLDIILTGTDPEGDPLTFSIDSGPSNGTLGSITALSDTSAGVTYTPDTCYTGSDSFVFQVDDGWGGIDTAIVSITVACCLTLNPTADSWVKNRDPETNYGTDDDLHTKYDRYCVDWGFGYCKKWAYEVRRSYLKFGLSDVPTDCITSAKLRLFRWTGESSDAVEVNTVSTGWTEGGITWNNAPTDFTHVDTINVGPAGNGWYEWDVTSAAQAAAGSDLSLALKMEDESWPGHRRHQDFYSKEESGKKPQLVLAYTLTADFTFSPPICEICPDDTVTFSGTATCCMGTCTYDWDFGDTNTGSGQNPTHQYAAGGDYTVTLTVTDANGCEDTVQKTVTVHPSPTADFEWSVPNCVCTDIQFTDLSTAGGTANITSWKWDFNDDTLIDSTEQNPTWHYDAPGAYNVTLTVDDSNGCWSEPVTKIKTVHPRPMADFEWSVPNCVCTDSQFHATASNGTPPYTYDWAFGDEGTGTGQDPTHHYTNAGNYTVTLTVTDEYGCSTVVEKEKTVHEAPTADFTWEEPNCACTDSQFHATASNGRPPYTYDWAFGDEGTGTGQDPTHHYTNAGNYTVTLTVTDNYGCSTVVEKEKTVHPRPTVQAGLDEEACIDADPFNLSGESPSGGTWSGTGITDPSNGTFDPATAGVGAHTITYSYTDANGCSNSDTKKVTVYDKPAVDAGLDEEACIDADPFNLSGESPSGGTWSGTGITDPSNGTFDPATAGVGAHTITYSYTDAYGCSNSDTKTVTVHASPDCTITLDADAADGAVDAESTGHTASVAVPAATPATYLWTITGDGTLKTGQSTASITWDADPYNTGTVNIKVQVTDANGCECEADVDVTVEAGAIPQAPEIHLTKTPDKSQAYVGDTIVYTYAVTIPGDISLQNITVTDNKCVSPTYQSGDTNSNDWLEAGETWVYTCSHVVTAGDNDPLVNTATARGYDESGVPTEDDDDATVDIVPGPPPVGGEAYPVNKLAILLPWITLSMAVMVGGIMVVALCL